MKITLTLSLNDYDLEALVHWRDWMQAHVAEGEQEIGCRQALRSLIRQWETLAKAKENREADAADFLGLSGQEQT